MQCRISMKPCMVALDGLHLRKSVEIELRLSGSIEGTPALGELCVVVDLAPLNNIKKKMTGSMLFPPQESSFFQWRKWRPSLEELRISNSIAGAPPQQQCK